MSRVFISYRRDDSADVTGRLFDRLCAHFTLFRDVDVIPFGSDFRQVIRKAVEDCQVLLAVIGPTWLNIAAKTGTRRLDDLADFVRLEIETALKRDIPVIPVLVGEATMPEPIHLPDVLQPLVFRHGLKVRRDPDFHRDVDTLIRGLTGLLDPPPPPAPPPPTPLVVAPLKVDPSTRILTELDPQLRPMPLRTEPEPDVEVEWVPSNEKAGTILQIVRFGSGKQPPKLALSAGPASNKLARLLTLPQLPKAARPTGPNSPLDRLAKAIRGIPWMTGSPEEVFKAVFDDFDEWLYSRPASDWLTQFARQATAEADTPDRAAVRSWWKALLGDRVKVYPHVDPETWEIRWPAEELGVPGIEWKQKIHVSAGRPVQQVKRFAIIAAEAEGVFSLGDPNPDGPVAKYEAIKTAAGVIGGGAEDFLPQLWAITVAYLLTNCPPADPKPAASLLDMASAALSEGKNGHFSLDATASGGLCGR
jgi:hypothetical protein